MHLTSLGDRLHTLRTERAHTHPHPTAGETRSRRMWINPNHLPPAFARRNPRLRIGGAVCIGLPPNLFLSENPRDVRQARHICNGCPARRQCLEYALEAEREGVWAGLTDKQRLHLAKERRYIEEQRAAGQHCLADKREERFLEEMRLLGLLYSDSSVTTSPNTEYQGDKPKVSSPTLQFSRIHRIYVPRAILPTRVAPTRRPILPGLKVRR